ncbi:MAG TPA: acyloxyacyl hydrolase [Nitrospira sp.]|nr:acyloxyacyl hydrolase [Nitrospira sp.]
MGLAILLGITAGIGAPASALADGEASSPPIGTQTISLSAGPIFPIRLTPHQSSKLFGAATALSTAWVVTNPLGSAWYQGRFSLGVGIIGLSTSEPVTAYGISLTPKLEYRFTGWGRLRPHVEGGGGPIWTDLGGRVPEQPGQFNFLVWTGAGLSWMLTPRWALTAGFRFMHISNAHLRDPNSGLNVGMPYAALSYSLF